MNAAVLKLLLLGLGLKLMATAEPQPPSIQGFSLADVSLAESGEFAANFNQTSEYLLQLEPDRLLFNFRKTAGLPTPLASYGGWEWSESEVRGQFIGHYLSAIAFAALHTGRPEFYDRSRVMVQELKKVQDALGNGYLSAFPESHFDRLEALQPVWAPYYVIHKIMAGLLDQHSLAGTQEALKMVELMADYFCARVQRVQENKGMDHWHKVLDNEFGGMNDVTYNLFAITQDEHHAECAHWFDKPAFYRPLVEGKDPLPGLHANTHLAQVQGFASRFEHLGDEEGMVAVRNFFALVLQHHSFSTGGSNWYEFWHSEDSLGDAINNTDASRITEESCTQYNILKIARYLFRHTGEPALADFYERAILNDVIGIQKMRSSAPDANSHRHQQHQQPHPHHHLATHLGQVRSPEQLVVPARRLEQVSAAGLGLTRPANYQIVSWPDDPYAAIRDPNDDQPTAPGIYIYYLPLGLGHTKGWGTSFETFWCCYGTAIESFSKLADSIYFKQMPGTTPSSSTVANSPHCSSGEDLPQLYINQLVSSSVRWRELGVEVQQEAELYSPDSIANARLTIAFHPPEAGTTNGARGEGDTAQARFLLNWRIPGWAKGSEVQLRVNGKIVTHCAEGAAGDEALGGQPPQFGAGAHFCSLGRTWTGGDVVEALMPMRVSTEVLNDGRKEMQAFKAIMIGPLAMAGLTHDTRDLVADPDHIEKHIFVPDSSGFVSLAVAGAEAGGTANLGLPDLRRPQLRHFNGSVALGTHGTPLDATFRLVAPLAGCERSASAACGSPRARHLLTQPAAAASDGSLRQEPRLVSFEAVSQPGHYLTTHPTRGMLLLHQELPANAAAQTFLLHPQVETAEGDGTSLPFTLEPLSQPGARLQLTEGDPQLRVRAATTTEPTTFRLVAPAAPSYPRGARLLHGRNRDYVLVPIGQIMDEHYTAYFNFVEGSE